MGTLNLGGYEFVWISGLSSSGGVRKSTKDFVEGFDALTKVDDQLKEFAGSMSFLSVTCDHH
jgi:hypothetical protein